MEYVCSSTLTTPLQEEEGSEEKQGTAWRRGPAPEEGVMDASRRWKIQPAGWSCVLRKVRGKQKRKGLQVGPTLESVLYSQAQEARPPSPPAQETAQEADGKASPGQSLQRSPVTRSQMRSQHLKNKIIVLNVITVSQLLVQEGVQAKKIEM